jgi:hypothetical protein
MKGGYAISLSNAMEFAAPRAVAAPIVSLVPGNAYSLTVATSITTYTSIDVSVSLRDVDGKNAADCASSKIDPSSRTVICQISADTLDAFQRDNVVQAVMILGGFESSSVIGYLHADVPSVKVSSPLSYGLLQTAFSFTPIQPYPYDNTQNKFTLSFNNGQVTANCTLTSRSVEECILNDGGVPAADWPSGDVSVVAIYTNGHVNSTANVVIGSVITPVIIFVEYVASAPLDEETLAAIDLELETAFNLTDGKNHFRVATSDGPNSAKRTTRYLDVTTLTPEALAAVNADEYFATPEGTLAAAIATAAPDIGDVTIINAPIAPPSQPLSQGAVAGIVIAGLAVICAAGGALFIFLSRREHLKEGHTFHPQQYVATRSAPISVQESLARRSMSFSFSRRSVEMVMQRSTPPDSEDERSDDGRYRAEDDDDDDADEGGGNKPRLEMTRIDVTTSDDDDDDSEKEKPVEEGMGRLAELSNRRILNEETPQPDKRQTSQKKMKRKKKVAPEDNNDKQTPAEETIDVNSGNEIASEDNTKTTEKKKKKTKKRAKKKNTESALVIPAKDETGDEHIEMEAYSS